MLRKRGKLDFAVNVPECLQIQAENKDGSSKESRTVAAVSNLATEKSGKFVCQTIEKFLDGIVPSEEKEGVHTILLLATPVREQRARLDRLCELYTAFSTIFPLAEKLYIF